MRYGRAACCDCRCLGLFRAHVLWLELCAAYHIPTAFVCARVCKGLLVRLCVYIHACVRACDAVVFASALQIDAAQFVAQLKGDGVRKHRKPKCLDLRLEGKLSNKSRIKVAGAPTLPFATAYFHASTQFGTLSAP